MYGPDADRREVDYTYDGVTGALTQVRDLAGNIWTYVYDGDQRLLGAITPSGSFWSVTYNPAGQVATVVDPLTDTTNLTYQSGTTTMTDPIGHATVFTFNGTGQLVRQSQTATAYDAGAPDTIQSNYQYDVDYNLTSYTDPRNQTFTATYDARGNPTAVTQPAAGTGGAATTTTYLYGDAQNPDLATEIRSPLGVVETSQYDSSGNLTNWSQGTLNQPPTATQTYSYYANGLPAAVRDVWGGITHYDYDEAGNLTRKTNALGYSSTFAYDWFGMPVRATDEEGIVTRSTYDQAGRLIQNTYADDTLTRTTLSPDGLVARTSDNNGNVTSYTYDKAARVTRVANAAGGVTKYRYDAAGNAVSVTDPNGWTTQYTYDEINRLKTTSISVTQPTAATYTTSRKYDAAGNMVKARNANGHEVTAQYDNLGRQTAQIVDPMGVAARSTAQFDDRGRQIGTVDPLWHRLSYTYDDLDRLTAVDENLLSGEQYASRTDTSQFTAVGAALSVDSSKTVAGNNSVKVTTAGSKVNEGLQVKVPVRISRGETVTGTATVTGTGKVLVRLTDRKNGTAPVSSATVTLSSGWTQTVPLAFTVSGAADSDDFILEVLTADVAQAATFNLDALQVNRRTSTAYSATPQAPVPVTSTHRVTNTNALGQATVTSYDLLGRSVSAQDPLGNTAQTRYLTGQHRVERTDAMGQLTAYQYDSRGRMVAVVYSDGASVTYTYDGNGNRLTMTDGLGTTAVTYDALNRPTRVVGPFGRAVAYRYAGTTLTQVDSLTGTVKYAYNEAGLPLNMVVIDPQNQTETTTFKFDGVGHMAQQDQGSQRVTWTYDAAERLTQIRGTNNGAQTYSAAYGYDKAGNRTSYTLTRSTSEGHSYTFDPLYRLIRTTDTASNVTRTYDYDAVGNRLRRTVNTNGTVTTDESYTYDQASRLVSMTATSSSKTEMTTNEYDANGNQIRMTSAKGSTTFHYDLENQLLEEHFPDGSVVVHRYDGDGRRMYTRDPSQEHYYQYDRGAIVADLDGAGALIAGYYRDLSGRLVSTHQRTGTYLYQADGLGSVIGLTKSDGSWDTQYSYDEFGIVSTTKGTAWNDFQFTGAPYHEMSGLYHLGSRYYNPSVGRFITQDTWGGSVWSPWTQNLYVYVGNNPVNYVDPTGHKPIKDDPNDPQVQKEYADQKRAEAAARHPHAGAVCGMYGDATSCAPVPKQQLAKPAWDDYFGENAAYTGGGGFHYGFDFSGAGIGTPVLSVMDGEVISVTNTCPNRPDGSSAPGDPTALCGGDDMRGTYSEMFNPPRGNNGNNVAIRHSDGSISLYAHLSAVGVRVGQTIVAGQQIGFSGASGFANGAHLHWEFWQNGSEGLGRVDPLTTIPWWNP